ncbi:LOW QUALITY PROTEIN: pathogen-associated molecular patterns-induced protein A70-like [Mangifera indica]|uniref:LOW QUALITY PROTEIN: pathogen-associated molecular patterns-induced protein A70-like n=1 Tax=Mangifera indica TaxID=29780 RepID=UPI001CFA6A94|nr:LOW QUALITY PROTEIN: pathogen-associated molecular patterns-induced protein A70-like [Mangifera indica]
MTDPSLLASITGWFTPNTLFLFVNLVIGTIALTSRFSSIKKPHAGAPEEKPSFVQPTSELLYRSHTVDSNPLQLARAPSLLQRVTSNLFSYKFPDPEEEQPAFVQATEPLNGTYPVDPNPPRLARAPSLLERVKFINFPSIYKSQQQPPFRKKKLVAHDSETDVPTDPGYKPRRSKSERKKSERRVQDDMKKSESEKSMKVEMENNERETETVEQRTQQTARLDRTVTIGDGDHTVDAKADDFINKFRRQLKLQRLDSLLRYKEMLKAN